MPEMSDPQPGPYTTTLSEREVTRAGNPGNPTGEFGAQMLHRMNSSHGAVTDWALDKLHFEPHFHTLDIGCGGGATMRRHLARMVKAAEDNGTDFTDLAKFPGHVTGVDYSSTSCCESSNLNAEDIAAGRMDVVEASVEDLPFEDGSFDIVTTVESFYFWPDPAANLREVARVVKPGGHFLLVADIYRTDELSEETLQNVREHDLTVLTPKEYRNLFAQAGFSACDVHLNPGTTWIAIEGVR